MSFTRRSFIKKIALALPGLVFLDAYWYEKYIIDWGIHNLSNRERPLLKVIQLSDLHLQKIRSYHKSIAERINKEKPEIVVITGDAITRNRAIQPLDAFLGLINQNIPKIAILGNKEYSGNIDMDALRQTYTKHNGHLLINQHKTLSFGEHKINIVGIDDFLCGYPDFNRAIQGMNPSWPTVILNHCPVYRKKIDKKRVPFTSKPLILSGHTHGGQITFFGIPIFTPYGSGDYVKGWYNNDASNMYVSKGIGTTGPPLRLGARAEANIFLL